MHNKKKYIRYIYIYIRRRIIMHLLDTHIYIYIYTYMFKYLFDEYALRGTNML